jgi:hypothetical protein
MKRTSIFPRQPEAVDVHDVRDLRQGRSFKSSRILMRFALALLVADGISWWVIAVYK